MVSLAQNPEDVEHGRWVYSVHRHLSAFVARQAAMFEATSYAGKAADLLGRLRGLREYPPKEVAALAQAAGITNRELRDTLLPRLEPLNALRVERRADGAAHRIVALVIDEDDVMAQAARLWHALDPEPSERAALAMVRATATLPHTEEELLEVCAALQLDEEDARRGLELATAHQLVQCRHVVDHGAELYYNDFLWGEDIERTSAALAVLKPDLRDDLRALLDELHRYEGRPLQEIESAPPHLVNLAVAKGLIEATPVHTSDGKTAHFHFTARFRGYGITREGPADALSQVRLVMASFAFATRFARFRLDSPEAFLQRLIDHGSAGNASPIGTDYGEMEKQKIVEVVPTRGSRYEFRVVKKDVLQQALDSMRAGMLLRPSGGSTTGGGLFDQQFVDPITNRVRLGQEAPHMPGFERDLLAAVRDAAQGTGFAR